MLKNPQLLYIRAIDGEDLQQFVPQLLETRYPGRSEELFSDSPVPGPFGWKLELDHGVAFIRATQTTHPFLWFRGGIAHAIPRSEELATHVATGNRDLMVGRAYLACGADVAMVVFDETIDAASLSMQYEPSIQQLITRFETSIQYTNEWAQAITEKFGGQRFSGDDCLLLTI